VCKTPRAKPYDQTRRPDAGLFLVTKADMSAIQSGKFAHHVYSSRMASASHARFPCLMNRLRGLAEGIIHGTSTPSRT